MRLKRDYKVGTLVKFKWYDRWQDKYERPDNFRITEGRVQQVQENEFLNGAIVYNGHENKIYAVPCENIIKEF